MKLVTYDDGAGPRVGLLEGDEIRDAGFDGEMVAFIEAGAPIGETRPVNGARLLAPLRPRSLRDFLTWEGHMKNALTRLGREVPQEWYEVPAYYKAFGDTVIGPDETIPWPHYTDRLDHELELAAVIGKPGRDIPRERALEHVFGWTIWNDLSARDVQTRELPIGMGPAKAKDWDGSNVLGPCIVTADEFDPTRGRLMARVDGEVWSMGSLGLALGTFPDLIAELSRSQTLYPGDIVGSGTFQGGCALDLGLQLEAGSVVELEAEGIGVLRNQVGTPPVGRAA